jgi:hypothetical protein
MPIKEKDIVLNKHHKSTERWEVAAIQGAQAKLKLLAMNKNTGEPIELDPPHFETVPVSALVLVESNDINTKLQTLKAHFQEQTGCAVFTEWKYNYSGHRFYFQEKDGRDWLYIVDIYEGDVEEQTASEIIANLNAANWRKVVESHAGKSVPLFKDKRFANPASFREWPQKVPAHR